MNGPAGATSDGRRRLIFSVGDRRHALDARLVLEIVKVGHLTRVPHGPEMLAGIANLRGRPIPVFSMARILGAEDGATTSRRRIIVYQHQGPIGLLVDDVQQLSDDPSVAILDALAPRLESAFRTAQRSQGERVSGKYRPPSGGNNATLRPLLSFKAQGQLYGLPLADVHEVAVISANTVRKADGDGPGIGFMAMRDGSVALYSLAELLGIGTAPPMDGRWPVVVIGHGGKIVGLIVDSLDGIHRLGDQAIDTVPAVLKRARGGEQIEAIGRLAQSSVLISILSAERLFNSDAVTPTAGENKGADTVETSSEKRQTAEQFLIFRLGNDDFGLPIAAVDEVIRLPDVVTRVPGAPAFISGMINLRGKSIALVDQRRRFDTPIAGPSGKSRAIILTLDGLQVGFVVDSVSEIKAIAPGALSDAPAFSTERTDVFDRVAVAETDGRMILLIDPRALLTRAERDSVTVASVAGMAVDP